MKSDSPKEARSKTPPVPVISDDDFRELLGRRASQALSMARYLVGRHWERTCFTRPLLGEILHQATELEELLDACGARNNDRWRLLRSTVAAAKLFADVNYVLLHIQHSIPAYRLLDVEGDFAASTDEAILFTGQTLLRISDRFLHHARLLGLTIPEQSPAEHFEERLPPGRLAHDYRAHKRVDAGETVTYLATAFLNQAAESELLHVPARVDPGKYRQCIPDSVSEEQVRRLQHQFHNLQSMYDTFVADTDTERENPDLLTLRGHLSVIFHLLEAATGFVHYYERHVMPATNSSGDDHELGPMVDGERLLDVLMRYALTFASRYLVRARDLCQEMLRRYAEVGQIEVPGPRYRGFHIRPSTLVAKIVHHYGGEVRMELEDGVYDASSPMDIFRANETINRQKRHWLVSQVADIECIRQLDGNADLAQTVRRVVLALAEQGKVVIYQRAIPIQPPDESDPNKTPLQYILDEVKRLQSTGMIDIEAKINVNFIGDKRVLRDLQLLAEHGYGEDNFGNNIPLPKELSYLRR
jgi:hypothetical protein